MGRQWVPVPISLQIPPERRASPLWPDSDSQLWKHGRSSQLDVGEVAHQCRGSVPPAEGPVLLLLRQRVTLW